LPPPDSQYTQEPGMDLRQEDRIDLRKRREIKEKEELNKAK